MATPVIMPRQGQSVESCIIAKWYKKPGDKVQTGDILFTYETDKASFDEEAKLDGTLLEVFFQEGDDVPCLLNVCVIGNPGESTKEFNPNGASANTEAAEKPSGNANVVTTAAPAPSQAAAPAVISDDVKISPRARNLADKAGLDFRYAAATGPEGRIIERDIVALQENGPKYTASAKDAYLGSNGTITGTGLGGRVTTADIAKGAAAPAAVNAANTVPAAAAQDTLPEVEEVKLSTVRKFIAKAMHQSLSTMAQLTLNSSFDATNVLEYRKQLKESKDRLGLENITLNDIILYAVSRTLKNHKDLNAHYLDDRMLYFKNVNLGVAVDTDRGLLVPTVFNANRLTLNEISKEVKKLVQDAQKGTISPDATKGGTFTITNLGTLDIESFTPVINPPQTAILGVCNIVYRVKEVEGELVSYPAMGLSLTFDHRALDGAPAARFLKELKENLENFSLLLVKG